MKSVFNTLLLGLFFCSTVTVLSSCDKEDIDFPADDSETLISNVTKPVFDKYLTTTTDSEVSFRCRFKNGGDTWENMTCTVHWCKYSSKPAKTLTVSDMTKHESMRQYATTSVSTTFDKTHTGFSGGTYVYYYFECKNSKYTVKTDVTYTVVKR